MATKTFNCNLNGGDIVTPNDQLTYRVYGMADNYESPIATAGSDTSDPNVTVTGDVVVITDLEIGVETSFKIASVDENGNEAPLSDSYNTLEYKLNFVSANSEYLNYIIATTVTGDFEIEFMYDNPVSEATYVLGSTGPYILNLGSAGRPQITIDGTATAQPPADTVTRAPVTGNKVKFVRTGASMEIFQNDISVFTTAIGTGDFIPDYIGRHSSSYSNVSLYWLRINNETWSFNEGSGSTTTGSQGTVLTLNSTVDVNAMWEQI